MKILSVKMLFGIRGGKSTSISFDDIILSTAYMKLHIHTYIHETNVNVRLIVHMYHTCVLIYVLHTTCMYVLCITVLVCITFIYYIKNNNI